MGFLKPSTLPPTFFHYQEPDPSASLSSMDDITYKQYEFYPKTPPPTFETRIAVPETPVLPYAVADKPNEPYSCQHFSTAASPNDDGTQVSDVAERLWIQYRTAQRNYRT